MKRMVLLVLAVALTVAGAFGSGSTEQAVPAAQAPTGTAAAGVMPLTLPLTTKGESLSIAVSLSVPTTDYNSLPVFKELEKRTGVKIEWEPLSASQWQASISTRLAAAVKLPDMLVLPNSINPVQYGKDGVLLRLNDYIDKYAPNWLQYFEQTGARSLMASPDDRSLYALWGNGNGGNDFYVVTANLRTDWLKKVGLGEPVSLDDWYAVLKAFKTRDPNGNGQADEIPMSDGYALGRIMDVFGTAFRMHLYQCQGFWPNASGNIEYDYVKPEMRELLAYCNRLWKEGLLDPALFADENKWDLLTSKISRNLVGATLGHYGNLDSREKLLRDAGVADAAFNMMSPPIGPSGYKGHIEHGVAFGARALAMAITKDCKNPQLAIRWLDYYIASPEGLKLNLMGIEGATWETAGGKTRYTAQAKSHKDGRLAALREIGAYCGFPGLDTGLAPRTFRAEAEAEACSPRQQAMMDRLFPLIVRRFELGMPTAEESGRKAAILKDLNTYRLETISKFVVGEVSLDKWDEYLRTMDKLGVQELLEITQRQYNRMK